VKIDLHLHSSASKRPSQWVLQKIGAPESFSKPKDIYRFARRLGMTAVTLTDHNTIDGVSEIAHLSGVFLSEEVTTYFPHDGCKVHVVVYDIDEAIHADLQRVRGNIYELVDYLYEKNLTHVLAHPFYSPNDRLSVENVERMCLLFKIWEINGTRDHGQKKVVKTVIESLTSKMIERLADKHGFAPSHDQAWLKGLTGGSDDHSSLNIARCYTEVPGARSYKDFLAAVWNREGIPQGHGSSPRTFAHNLYGIAYQFFKDRFNLERYAGKDILMRFLDRMLCPESEHHNELLFRIYNFMGRNFSKEDGLKSVIRRECAKSIRADADLTAFIKKGSGDDLTQAEEERWFRFVGLVSDKVLLHFSNKLFNNLAGVNFFRLFDTIGSAVSQYALLAPYFVSYGLFGRDRPLSRKIVKRFAPNSELATSYRTKVVHFTDTFYDVNGVARTLNRQADVARNSGLDLTIVTCSADNSPQKPNVKNFKPVTTFMLPEYPQQKLIVPPFLEMLDFVYEGGFTTIHSATPGPMGLAALAIARVLDLPISGTYHTAIPQYASYLTGDQNIEEVVWRYTLWYYDQMAKVYVPSSDTGDELAQKGIKQEKLTNYPRGIDLGAFNPEHRNGFYRRIANLSGEVTKLLYVGRVSREKNLSVLARAFKQLSKKHDDLHLVIVGDGPYREDMQNELTGYPATFTGYLAGGELSQAYASADLFVFPSSTDTFGNVILEAQASGLPVVVTDSGGPRENMVHGVTGLVVPGKDASSLTSAIASLLDNPEKRLEMGRAARLYMQDRSFETAFKKHFQMYAADEAARHELS
jgi:glycosyltransferase involved in cell wall biosynthesis